MTKARVTQKGSSVVILPEGVGARRITQLGGQALVVNESPPIRVTHLGTQVPFVSENKPKVRLSSLCAKVLFRHKPARIPKPPAIFNAVYSEHRGIVNDPFYDKVELLLNADHYGLRDLSKKRRGLVISPAGGPGLDSGLSKFGQNSMMFCWLQESSIYAAGFIWVDNSNGDFNIGNSQFTAEAWIRVSNESPTNKPIVGVWHESTNRRSWLLRLNNGSLQFLCSPDGVNVTTIQGTIVNFDVWNHVAVDRDNNGVVRLYLNGTMVGSDTVDFPFFLTDRELVVGFAGTIEPESKYVQEVATGGFVGRMDDLRITRGWARYKTNGSFTPPEAAFAFTPIEEPDYYEDGDLHFDKVVLLLDAGVSTNLVDYSQNPTTITGSVGLATYPMYGIPDHSLFVSNGTLVEMDGSDDRFNLNGPMTFEVFAHFASSAGTVYTLFEIPNHFRIRLGRFSSEVQAYKEGAWVTLADPSSGWEHQKCFALCRDDKGTLRIYFNGWFLTKIEDDVWDEPAADAPLRFNPELNSGSVRFSKVRITKGVARWTHEDSYAADMELYRPWPRQQATPPSYNPTYPGSLEVANAGAEQPSTLMWEAATGTKPAIVPDPEVTPHSGDYVYDSGASRFNWYYQTIDIPVDYWGDIDAGHVQLIANGWAKGELTGDDWGALYVAAVGKSREDVRYMHVTPVDDPSDWTEISHSFWLPRGTRRVRIGVQAHRDPENETLQLYWDDFSLTLDIDEEAHIEAFSLPYPVSTDGLAVSRGLRVTYLPTNYGMATIGLRDVEVVYFYTIHLPEELAEDLDDEGTPLTLVLDYHLVGRIEAPNDSGHLFLDFVDEAGETLGRIYDEDVPYVVPLFGESRVLEVEIPTGSRKCRLGLRAYNADMMYPVAHPLVFASARIEYRDSDNEVEEPDFELIDILSQKVFDFEDGLVPQEIADAMDRTGASVVDDPDLEIGSIKSLVFPAISHNDSTYFDLDVLATDDNNTIKIRYKTSSENNFDWFRIYLDGEVVAQASGTSSTYSEFVRNVTPGNYKLRLEYSKDSSASAGSDTVFISYISIPVELQQPHYRLLQDYRYRLTETGDPRILEDEESEENPE